MCLRLSVSVHVSQMFFVCANIVLRSSSIGTPSCVQNLEWTCVRREKPMKYHAFSLPLLEQAQKNVFLEERVQVLQQQNEDLLAQIQMNLAISRCVSGAVSASAPENRCNVRTTFTFMSFWAFSAPCRQLSEENANLQESVEKESTEKKRLSMNNEELLWRLQTSPLMSPASSPLHRSFSTSPVPSSPLFLLSSSPSNTPAACCDSPTHCQGCSQMPHHGSPSHRAGANHNLSSSPATPTHRAAGNLNYSPGPATPTHRVSANRCNPAACLSSLQR